MEWFCAIILMASDGQLSHLSNEHFVTKEICEERCFIAANEFARLLSEGEKPVVVYEECVRLQVWEDVTPED